jgi:hypothetical protein
MCPRHECHVPAMAHCGNDVRKLCVRKDNVHFLELDGLYILLQLD